MELTELECWRLLSRGRIGRLAISIDGHPDIFPVNFLARDGRIFFRSAPGSKLQAVAESPIVAFECDGRGLRRRWSVVVKGTAHRLDRDDEIERSGVLALTTATDTEKWNYVRIDPVSVTGRRF